MTPRVAAFWRSTGFRLTMLGAALFAASAGMLVFVMFGTTVAALARQTDRALAAEMAEVKASYDTGGLNALNREVVRRTFATEDFAYLLAYPNGRRISGEPDRMPETRGSAAAAIRFVYDMRQRETGEVIGRRAARGRVTELPGGYRLMVWRDVEEDARVLTSLAGEAWSIAAVVLVLGLLSGAFLSNRFVRRVDALNAVAQDVMSGDLASRAPRTGTGDELDALSANLNAMLERIETLMRSMRHAGDSIAHDLRSPLTRLRNRLEAALLDSEADREEQLREALVDADELLTTFNAVLRLARLQAGEKRAPFVMLDPAELVRDLAELFEPACEEKGVEFICEIADGLTVKVDRALFSQAIANLLDNAVKYTPAGGAVALRLRRSRAGETEVSVTDTGPGIPAADRERVTERFVRLDASRNEPGVGLGLSLVEAVAELHGGALVLDEGPGAVEDGAGPGLRAALVLPRADA
ncbi:MAG: ATP-binding protein [Caulobacterales bacterium]|nr:ATP-binding protein [Caulobacterales bacterium]